MPPSPVVEKTEEEPLKPVVPRVKLPAKKVKEADFYDKFKPDDSDFELSESDLEELREFGYHSEDEMEDYFAQEAIDMFDDNKLAQLEG